MRNVMLCAAILGLFASVQDTSEAANPKKSKKPYPKVVVNPRLTPGTSWTVPALCKAYSFPQYLKGGGVIGIVELGGAWSQEDLDAFSAANNMPKISVTNVSVMGGQPVPDLGGADIEVMLDIEVAAAAYYYCTGTMPTIKVLFAPNTTAAFEACIPAAVTAGCDVLSISWGQSEDTWEHFNPGTTATFDAACKTAAASGLTIFAAAGDNDSGDNGFSFTSYALTDPHVDFPASSPHVVACGGTTKPLSGTEIVWGVAPWDYSFYGYIFDNQGTGGGYSDIFPKQAFQVGAPVSKTKSTGRLVPDVAANADPATGYQIYADGYPWQVGGTSAVAPLYAGLFASFGKKLNASATTGTKVHASIWGHPTIWTDITKGTNGDYTALTGPDPCSGMGVPKGTSVAATFGAGASVFNYVGASWTAAGGLVLTGDAGNNNITVALNNTTHIVTVTGIGATQIGNSTTHAATATFNIGTTPLSIAGTFSQGGNDTFSMSGTTANTVALTFGAGNDNTTLTLDVLTKLTYAGGAGTNTLVLTGTKITSGGFSTKDAIVVR